MKADLKENERKSQWLIHLYDAGDVWIAYKRSALLLLFVLGDSIIHAYSIIDRPSGYLIFKAEITKKNFIQLVPLSSIINNDIYHKVLDFHISPQKFEEWMDDEGIPY